MNFYSEMVRNSVFYTFFLMQFLIIYGHPNCKNLDNGQISNNPVFKESSCSNECLICQSTFCENVEGSECPISACATKGE